MGRRKIHEELRKSCSLPHIRVTEKEYETVTRMAEERELNITDFLRILIFRRLPKHRLKKLQLVDTKVVAELSRQGANLRNLYNSYGKSETFDSNASYEILSHIDETVLSIKRVYDEYYSRVFGVSDE